MGVNGRGWRRKVGGVAFCRGLCLAAGLLLAGCTAIEPMARTAQREALRRADALIAEQLVESAPTPLDDIPVEAKQEVYRRAKAVVTPESKRASMELGLDAFRKSVLENNLGLKVERFNPATAEERFLAEQGKFEAILTGSASQQDAYDGADAKATTQTITPSVEIPNRLGGNLSMGFPYTLRKSDQIVSYDFLGKPVVEGTTYTAGIDLSAEQPLLRNAGLRANYASINISGLQARQADARMKLAAIRLLALAEQSYWRYYADYENLKIQVNKYEMAQEQLRMARRMVEEGVRTKVEVTRADAGVAREFEAVIQAETTRRISERELKKVMNIPDLPVESTTVFQCASHPSPVGLVFDRQKVLALASDNRMELFENELQQLIADITVDLNRNLSLPDLRLNFKYSYSGSQPTFNKALETILDREFNAVTLGLFTSIPLEGNISAKARWRESVLSRQQTLAERAELELAIRQEVLDAMDSLEQNWKRIIASRLAVDLAREAYEAEKTQFQYGLRTSTDVLNALSDLSTAESTYVRALTDYQNALVDVAFATGTVLGESGVVWTPLPSVR